MFSGTERNPLRSRAFFFFVGLLVFAFALGFAFRCQLKYQLEVVHHDGNQTQSNIPKMRVKKETKFTFVPSHHRLDQHQAYDQAYPRRCEANRNEFLPHSDQEPS